MDVGTFWEVSEYVGEILVFAGVIGEVLTERKLVLKKNDFLRDSVEGIASWVLIVGLAVSLAALIGTNRHFNETIADLNQRASQANERATANEAAAAALKKGNLDLSLKLAKQGERTAKAEIDIGAAKQQAAKAESDFAASLERTKRLESQLSWRTVTPKQTKEIKDFLSPLKLRTLLPFRGVRITFSYLTGDAEAGEYAEDLANTLRKVLDGMGAEISEPTSMSLIGQGPPPTGLFIEVHSRSDGAANAAGWLQRALTSAGIDTPGELGAQEMNINFFVASKPRVSPEQK